VNIPVLSPLIPFLYYISNFSVNEKKTAKVRKHACRESKSQTNCYFDFLEIIVDAKVTVSVSVGIPNLANIVKPRPS